MPKTKLPFSYRQFKKIYSKVPRLNVEVVIHTDDGIVLTKRSIEPCKGQWHIPGGTVYINETLEQALKRVALGELGVEVKVGELLGYIEYPHMKADGYFGWPIGLAFSVSITGGQLQGSYQGEEFGIFKTVPENTVQDQKELLEKLLHAV